MSIAEDCHAKKDGRFAVQQISMERWQRAAIANLAADHSQGFSAWTSSFISTRPELYEFGNFLLGATMHQSAEFANEHKHESLALLVMMLTGACNADCPICFTDRRRKPKELVHPQRDRVLAQAATLGASYVYVPGEGEPTIDPHWWEFLDSCRNYGLEAVVFSNGLIFSDEATCQRYWNCSIAEAIERLNEYTVSLYIKLWSTDGDTFREMLSIPKSRLNFSNFEGLQIQSGMVRLLEEFKRDRLGIEVVVERRNVEDVITNILPFADRHGLAKIVELIQHNGRSLNSSSNDPSPNQVLEIEPFLSPTSCKLAVCKAVVTSQGFLSPRIAILENQLPAERVHVDQADLWTLLHSTPYIVERRYELSCLCENEPKASHATNSKQVGPSSIVPDKLVEENDRTIANVAVRCESSATAIPQTSTNHLRELMGNSQSDYDVAALTGRVVPLGQDLGLQDGPDCIRLITSSLQPYSWVSVEGVWDGKCQTLTVKRANVLQDSKRIPSPNQCPEVAYVEAPHRLAAFQQRAQIKKLIRGFLDDRGFVEVTTPMLQASAEMCCVGQVQTEAIHGRPFFIRTDPEEYLKRYLVAGLESVYEISTNVRDEGSDTTHLIEFQSLEFYQRLLKFDGVISLSDDLIRRMLANATQADSCRWNGFDINYARPFRRVRYCDLLEQVTGIDILHPKCSSVEGLKQSIERSGLQLTVEGSLAKWRRTWIESLFDRYAIPTLTEPVWVTHFPVDIALSSRVDEEDDRVSCRAELFAPTGLELAHVYENLTNPLELRERYDQRRYHRVAAGMSFVPTNEGLMQSAEFGMPPMAGAAIGIDRVLMISRNEIEIGNGLLFPRECEHRSHGSACGGCKVTGRCHGAKSDHEC